VLPGDLAADHQPEAAAVSLPGAEERREDLSDLVGGDAGSAVDDDDLRAGPRRLGRGGRRNALDLEWRRFADARAPWRESIESLPFLEARAEALSPEEFATLANRVVGAKG